MLVNQIHAFVSPTVGQSGLVLDWDGDNGLSDIVGPGDNLLNLPENAQLADVFVD